MYTNRVDIDRTLYKAVLRWLFYKRFEELRKVGCIKTQTIGPRSHLKCSHGFRFIMWAPLMSFVKTKHMCLAYQIASLVSLIIYAVYMNWKTYMVITYSIIKKLLLGKVSLFFNWLFLESNVRLWCSIAIFGNCSI